jgi:hypothetical protein
MKYIATGRVHPERADVRFSTIHMNTGGGGSISVHCDASQITVALDHSSLDGYISAYAMATDFAYMVIAAMGFSLASGYSVEIVQVTEQDGVPHVMGVRVPGLEFTPHDPMFERALRHSAEDLFFRLALRDYTRAIVDIRDCATYCYRSIEAVKAACSMRAGDESWKPMHDALGTDRDVITAAVKNFADPVRHGNWSNAPTTNAVQRFEMLRVTRDVLVKYLDYARPVA